MKYFVLLMLFITGFCGDAINTGFCGDALNIVTLPVIVFDRKVSLIDEKEEEVKAIDSSYKLEAGKKYRAVEENGLKTEFIPVNSKVGSMAPAWAMSEFGPGVAFDGGEKLRFTIDKAKNSARGSLAPRDGQSHTISSKDIELIVTIAADAADQPKYEVPGERFKGLNKMKSDGKPGRPWVRCWVKVEKRAEDK